MMFYLWFHGNMNIWIEALKTNEGTVHFTHITDQLLTKCAFVQMTPEGHRAFWNWYNSGSRYVNEEGVEV